MSDQFSYKTPDTFERVQKIFEERDGEYRKMEEMNRVREEKIKKQENNLKEKEQQIRSREETVGQQENKLEEGSVMLRHAQDGDMVTIMSPEIEVTAVFAIKEPWFDIKKKIEVTHKIRRLIRNWNNSQNELTFSYDSVDHTVTGTGDFTTDKTAEELFNYLDGLLDKYFDPGEKK